MKPICYFWREVFSNRCYTSVSFFGCWLMHQVIYLKQRQKSILLKAEQIHKITTIFTQNDDHFQTWLITWFMGQQPKSSSDKKHLKRMWKLEDVICPGEFLFLFFFFHYKEELKLDWHLLISSKTTRNVAARLVLHTGHNLKWIRELFLIQKFKFSKKATSFALHNLFFSSKRHAYLFF